MPTDTATHAHRYSRTTGYCSCGNRPLGALTDAQRAAKAARAAKLLSEASMLLDELYRDREDATYRMGYASPEENEHRALAEAATLAEKAARVGNQTAAAMIGARA